MEGLGKPAMGWTGYTWGQTDRQTDRQGAAYTRRQASPALSRPSSQHSSSLQVGKAGPREGKTVPEVAKPFGGTSRWNHRGYEIPRAGRARPAVCFLPEAPLSQGLFRSSRRISPPFRLGHKDEAQAPDWAKQQMAIGFSPSVVV